MIGNETWRFVVYLCIIIAVMYLDDIKDEHKDWKPLNIKIMRRFTLLVSSSTFAKLLQMEFT